MTSWIKVLACYTDLKIQWQCRPQTSWCTTPPQKSMRSSTFPLQRLVCQQLVPAEISCFIDAQLAFIATATAGSIILILLTSTIVLACTVSSLKRHPPGPSSIPKQCRPGEWNGLLGYREKRGRHCGSMRNQHSIGGGKDRRRRGREPWWRGRAEPIHHHF